MEPTGAFVFLDSALHWTNAMARRIVECGRVEVRGAIVRFKQRGTLEATERNFAHVEQLFVRTTPSPELRVFVDFVFTGDVFRIWPDATLINYRDFLEKVALAGPENFRAFLRYAVQAAPERADVTSRAFVDGTGPAERFSSKDELADYDRALARSEVVHAPRAAPGAGAPEPAPTSTPADMLARQAEVERLWNELAPALIEEPPVPRGVSRAAGAVLILLGFVTGALALRAFRYVNGLDFPDDRSPAGLFGVVAVGAVAALGFFTLGLVFLRRE